MSAESPNVDRQAIFATIVHIQDEGVSVADSRSRVAAQFGINVDQVCEIEGEGIAKNWPPL